MQAKTCWFSNYAFSGNSLHRTPYLSLLASITFIVIVSRWQKNQVIKQIKHRLHNSAALIRSDDAGMLANGPS